MMRNIYSIASDSKEESSDISRLNPADSLFGWVGSGPNNAITGRVSFGFGIFDDPPMAWYKVPYPYGQWTYAGDKWEESSDGYASKVLIDKTWRIFPHAPLAPLVKQTDDFLPDTYQAEYFKAILPGAKFRLNISFWNLLEEELQRLIWCVVLDPGLAHKMGKRRYLGFGSLQMEILKESFLIDWKKRYSGEPEESWRLPISIDKWLKPNVIEHHSVLKKVLNAERL